MNKAYIIHTTLDDTIDSFTVMSATTAGRAKTALLSSIREAYPEENYSCITSCRRAKNYDQLAQKYSGCIAWRQNIENWEQDKGHWFGLDEYK